MRRFSFAFLFLLSLSPAFAQVPPAVPALPDTERRTSYSISASTCSCGVGFQLFGDGTDYASWVEVFINGTRVNYNDATYGWTITSPSGSLSSLPRPITNAVLTFTSAQTGTVQIVGARRPRRTSQFNESAGVPTRNFNQVLTDIISQNREIWDKTNDMTGRGFFAPPGQTGGVISGPLSGVIFGPPSVTSGNLTAWNGTSGAALSDSGVNAFGTFPAFLPVVGSLASFYSPFYFAPSNPGTAKVMHPNRILAGEAALSSNDILASTGIPSTPSWLDSMLNGSFIGNSQLGVTSVWGSLAITGGARTSDYRTVFPDDTLGSQGAHGLTGVAINDDTVPGVPTASGVNGFGFHQSGVGNGLTEASEFRIASKNAVTDINPYTGIANGATVAVNSTSGYPGFSEKVSAAQNVGGTAEPGALFRKGIVFQHDGFDTSVGAGGGGVMTEYPTGGSQRWLKSDGSTLYEQYANNFGSIQNVPSGSSHIAQVNGANITFVTGSAHFPATTNTFTSGISAARWANVFSVLGDFSGQITSSVATGTPPFVVSSSTQVANLSAATAGISTRGAIAATTTNASFFPMFASSSSGNQLFNVDTNFTYNPSTDTLSTTNANITTITGSTNLVLNAQGGVVIGQVGGASITYTTGSAFIPVTDNTFSNGATGTRWSTVFGYVGDFTTGVTVGGSAGLTTTKTVRAAGGASDCTLVFKGGILTGGTC